MGLFKLNYVKFLILILSTCFLLETSYARTVEASLKDVQSRKEFIEVSRFLVVLDLRYASENNFLNQNVYGLFNRAFLHEKAAEKLSLAIQYLQQSHPGYRFIIFDALRPRSVQYKLWEHVKGTAKEKYVANPVKGSAHNYGFALDLSVLNDKGQELDMGTGFDVFDDLSQPSLEAKFISQGRLSAKQLENRMILRKAMTQAGFIQLPTEWWHFDALPKSDVIKQYKIVE